MASGDASHCCGVVRRIHSRGTKKKKKEEKLFIRGRAWQVVLRAAAMDCIILFMHTDTSHQTYLINIDDSQ